MAYLKMTKQVVVRVQRPIWVEPIVTVAAERDGVFRPAVDRDARVAKGATLGSITDYLGRPLQDVVAPDAGIVMFVRAVPSLKKGDTIANIGVLKPQP